MIKLMKSVVSQLVLASVAILLSASHAAGQAVITLLGGNGITQYIGDGYPATNYSFALPEGLCKDKAGNLLIADFANSRIRLLIANDTLKTLYGNGTAGYFGDFGQAVFAELNTPNAVCTDTAGNVYIGDYYDAVVRKVDIATGIITTVCGSGINGFYGDGGPATAAKMQAIGSICLDNHNNIYIPDYSNHRIRKVTASTGIISTIAGNGMNGYTGDSSAATAAELSYPSSVCADAAGNIYFTEHGNHTVRRIDAQTGIITTVAGRGTYGYSGDNGAATAAYLNLPVCVFADNKGIIYIADAGNNVIRDIDTAGIIHTIAGSGGYGFAGSGGHPLDVRFHAPSAVFADDSGTLYIADGGNSAVWSIRKPTNAVSELTVKTVSIYPNPSAGMLHVNIEKWNAFCNLELYDATGKLLLSENTNQADTDLDISTLPTGIYILKIATVNTVRTFKIIRQ
jgi:trimeric autotransporter adhesin